MKVTVVDALMGSGKTYQAIQLMGAIARRSDPFATNPTNERFLYITPFKTEVQAVKDKLRTQVETLAVDPDDDKYQTLLESIKMQALYGQNIVSTHALFNLIDADFIDAIEQYRYTLFIDEVADWVHDLSITAGDYTILTQAGVITIDPGTQRVLWNDELFKANYRGAYSKLRTHCKEGRAYLAHDENAKQDRRVFLVYQFPIEFLRSFEKVYILTHLYDGSLMSAFLKLHGIDVEKLSIAADRGSLVPYDSALEASRVAGKAPLIHACHDPAMNAIGTKAKGTKARPLSHTWFANQAKTPAGKTNLKKLGNLLYGWLRHEFNASTSQVMWSTYDPQAAALSSKLATYLPKKKRVGRNIDEDGHPRHSFVPFNARASNHWREKDLCAYLVNLHHNATIANWFSVKGIELSDDYFALTTMVQWVFRSAIRDGKRIDLWIPSGRMREIFRNWLAGKLPDGAKFATPAVADLRKSLCLADS